MLVRVTDMIQHQLKILPNTNVCPVKRARDLEATINECIAVHRLRHNQYAVCDLAQRNPDVRELYVEAIQSMYKGVHYGTILEFDALYGHLEQLSNEYPFHRHSWKSHNLASHNSALLIIDLNQFCERV